MPAMPGCTRSPRPPRSAPAIETAPATELQALEAAGARLRRGDQAFVHYLRGWIAALESDAAAPHGKRRWPLALAVEIGIPWLECLARVVSAQLLAAEGDHRGANAQIRSAEEIAKRIRSPLLSVSAQLAAAGTAIQGGDEQAALDMLKATLAAGRGLGLRYIPALRPQVLAEICALALRHGIEPEFVRAMVRARNLPPPPSALRVKQWPRPFVVSTLGGFTLARESAPIEFSSKGPGRPLELLKVLVAMGGQNVRSEQLADALWPRVDADYAHKSFTTTLHRLRRIFDDDEAIVLRDTRLSLDPRRVWLDTWALDHLLAELDGALRDPRSAGPALRALVDEALTLYRGPFLPDESEQPSYIACREQVASETAARPHAGRALVGGNGKPEVAADCYSSIDRRGRVVRNRLSQPDGALPAPRRQRRSRRDLRAAAHPAVGTGESHAVTRNPGGVCGTACSASRQTGAPLITRACDRSP